MRNDGARSIKDKFRYEPVDGAAESRCARGDFLGQQQQRRLQCGAFGIQPAAAVQKFAQQCVDIGVKRIVHRLLTQDKGPEMDAQWPLFGRDDFVRLRRTRNEYITTLHFVHAIVQRKCAVAIECTAHFEE